MRPGDECELLVYGAPAHTARLDKLLQGDGGSAGGARILFPGKPGVSMSVAEFVAECSRNGSAHASTAAAAAASTFASVTSASQPLSSPSTACSPTFVTVIVPDGSWEHVRVMVKALVSRAKAEYGRDLGCVRLVDRSV